MLVFLLLHWNRFSWYTLIFPTSQSKRASDNTTNQNSCDVTAVFPYSHLNTAIDQSECAYYPNYFIKRSGLQGHCPLHRIFSDSNDLAKNAVPFHSTSSEMIFHITHFLSAIMYFTRSAKQELMMSVMMWSFGSALNESVGTFRSEDQRRLKVFHSEHAHLEKCWPPNLMRMLSAEKSYSWVVLVLRSRLVMGTACSRIIFVFHFLPH